MEVDPYMVRTVGDMKKVMSLFDDDEPLTFFADVYLRERRPVVSILPKGNSCRFRVSYRHKDNRAVEIMPFREDLRSIEV